jgi:hypothetical protein
MAGGSAAQVHAAERAELKKIALGRPTDYGEPLPIVGPIGSERGTNGLCCQPGVRGSLNMPITQPAQEGTADVRENSSGC